MKRWEEIGKNRGFSAIFPQLGICNCINGAFCTKKDTDSLILIDSDELRKNAEKGDKVVFFASFLSVIGNSIETNCIEES